LKLDVGGSAKNSKIYKLHDEYDVKFIKHGTFRWSGHVTRMEESDPAKKILCTKPGGNGGRMRGRPKLRWCHELGEGHHTGWVLKLEN
jgi:hypothetical protein